MVSKQESSAYYKALGAYIAQLRRAKGMTQAELARTIGVSQQAVFAYETSERRVSVYVLIKMAKVFSIPVDQLMGISKPVRIPKRRVSARAVRHGERLQALTKTQQRFVLRILDMLEEENDS
jgi:transcriptional regulator with XRE-family HTH domain